MFLTMPGFGGNPSHRAARISCQDLVGCQVSWIEKNRGKYKVPLPGVDKLRLGRFPNGIMSEQQRGLNQAGEEEVHAVSPAGIET